MTTPDPTAARQLSSPNDPPIVTDMPLVRPGVVGTITIDVWASLRKIVYHYGDDFRLAAYLTPDEARSVAETLNPGAVVISADEWTALAARTERLRKLHLLGHAAFMGLIDDRVSVKQGERCLLAYKEAIDALHDGDLADDVTVTAGEKE